MLWTCMKKLSLYLRELSMIPKPPYRYELLGNVPPRMTSVEIAAFINGVMRMSDPERVRRQKELEERIEKRFYFPDEESVPTRKSP